MKSIRRIGIILLLAGLMALLVACDSNGLGLPSNGNPSNRGRASHAHLTEHSPGDKGCRANDRSGRDLYD